MKPPKISDYTHDLVANALRETRLYWIPMHAPKATNAELRAMERYHRARAKSLPKRCAARGGCLRRQSAAWMSERWSWWQCSSCKLWFHTACALRHHPRRACDGPPKKSAKSHR